MGRSNRKVKILTRGTRAGGADGAAAPARARNAAGGLAKYDVLEQLGVMGLTELFHDS